MTGDTSRREQARAVFLSLLMVGSVMAIGGAAFAGSAAAQQETTPTNEVVVEAGNASANYQSIQNALNNTGDGTLITVREGTYSESLTVSNSNVTIQGAGVGNSVINGTEVQLGGSDLRSAAVVVGSTYGENPTSVENVSISGFTIRQNTTNNGVLETTGNAAQANITLEDNRFVTNGSKSGSGAYLPNVKSVLVANNTFAVEGDSEAIEHIATASDSEQFTIEDNTFEGDLARPSQTSGGNAIEVRGSDFTVQNNDFTGVSVDGAIVADISDDLDLASVLADNTFDRTVTVEDSSGTLKAGIFGNIQSAVSATSADDTVSVGPGTYNESVNVDVENVTLVSSEGPEQTEITDPDEFKEVVEVTASNVTVNGFTVTSEGTKDSNYGAYGIRVIPRSENINNVSVKNNIIKNISDVYRAVGISVSTGETGNQLQDITVESNIIYDIETRVTTRPNAGNSIAKGITQNGDVSSSETINNNITDIGGEESAASHGIALDGVGPTNFTVANNYINSLETNESVPEGDTYFNDPSALIVGGFSNLGADHAVYSNNFLDGQVYRYDAGQSTDTLNATSNWWGATNGPGGEFNGNGSAVTGSVSVDPATVSLDDGSVNLTQDFVGVVKDSQNVTLNDTSDATFSFDSESVPGELDGTLVLGINGTDYVFENVLDDGAINTSASGAEVDSGKNGTSIANTTPTGDTTITVVGNNSTTAVEDAGSVTLVHEAVGLSEGYNLKSVPQPAKLYTQDVDATNQWNPSGDTYESLSISQGGDVDRGTDLHRGLYVDAASNDARLGYSFATSEVPRPADVVMGNGWHLVGSNFDINSESGTRELDVDLRNVENVTTDGSPGVTAYDSGLSGDIAGSSDINEYDTYWVYVDGEQTRVIVAPNYDPNGR